MLRRAAATTATLNGRAAEWFRRLTQGPVTLPPAHLGRQRHHPQAQLRPPRAVVSAPPLLPRLCGARGYSYRRMARRIPMARPDGYSSSDGEAEDPDAREAGEITEPVGGAGAEGDDDSEGSEVEGFMLDLSSFPGSGDEEGTEEGGK
ncbi:uncharacterized protein LOC110433311 [Sorghum bicolor]|uniref:Uncharacterized protein n=1 Tax=Sorghum bicolor TaxID=4558 RepID=A0A1B6Q4K4_SORBI|nr:uncharacterized protein LOC110433311 [Sorghum bicolor]KXG32844.1 hypothetical protein SORBI_3003G213600 [Sorghum bicolor]|eukprot:XP_021310821.1 uncharacterized protein LOC110433311 [Sorghum bicolor]